MRRNPASQELARKRILKKRGNRCEQCGYTGYVELHHIKAVVDGGSHEDANLLLLCEQCHADVHGYKKRKYLDPHRKNWKPS